MFNVDKLINERDAQYGSAWLHTGRMMHPVSSRLYKLLDVAPDVFYNWVIILNKLVRLLADPWNKDTWADIAGYATLVVNYIDQTSARPEERSSTNDNKLPSK
jgi:hypothetical protein